MYKFVRNIIIILVCHVLFRVRYKNTQILENYDKCLICPNHSRIFDPIFIYPKVKDMYSVAKSEIFEKKLVGDFIRYHNAIPIKREQNDINGTRNIIRLLEEHDKIKLLIFPEGGVFKENYANNKRKTKNGAVYITALTNVPIIPVHITVRPKFFSRVEVTFGEPVFISNEALKDKKLLRQEAKKLINHIYEM